MTYNYIFSSAIPKSERFSSFGFVQADDGLYSLKKNLSDSLYAVFSLDMKKSVLEVHVFDCATDEPYTLFDVSRSHGAFVTKVREQVQSVINDFCRQCFEFCSLREKYVDFIQKQFSSFAEFPWGNETSEKENQTGFKTAAFADYAVFRCPNKKWFALIMNITYRQLGFSSEKSEEKVWVVNLKAEPEQIAALVDKNQFILLTT